MIAPRSSLPNLAGLTAQGEIPADPTLLSANPPALEPLLVATNGSLLSLPSTFRRNRRTGPPCFAPGCRHPALAKGLFGHAVPDFDASFRRILEKVRLSEAPVADATSALPAAGVCEVRLLPIDVGDDFVLELYLRDVAAAGRKLELLAPAGATGNSLYDDAARERLVLGHLPRVVRLALEFRSSGLPLADLVNEGNIGLMRAAELYDPERQVPFSHYAKTWIRMQMKRAVSYQAWPVSLPADFSWRRGQVLGAEERLTKALNREPNEIELAAECGLELPAVQRIRSTPAPSFVTFESPASDRQAGYTLEETLPDQTVATPDEAAIRKSDLEFVESLLASLTPCQQRVIRLRFGLDDGCAHTLEEVALLLGYVRQGIHRLETTALSKLAHHARFLEFDIRHTCALPLPPHKTVGVSPRCPRKTPEILRRLRSD
jgi:RNA polymerase primary sigma factor